MESKSSIGPEKVYSEAEIKVGEGQQRIVVSALRSLGSDFATDIFSPDLLPNKSAWLVKPWSYHTLPLFQCGPKRCKFAHFFFGKSLASNMPAEA